MLGLRATVYIALSCVSAVVLHSVLSSSNKVDDSFLCHAVVLRQLSKIDDYGF